jgi:HD superfamily phosphohydrolase
MHIARQLSDTIGLSQKEIRRNGVAGLLHDVGHLPYSHTLEKLFERKKGKSHESISCEFVDEISEDDDVEFPVNPEKVKEIILGEYNGINVVSNEIDADRLDYLLRDSYNTGIDLGQIEEATLIKFAERINGNIGFNHKSLKSVEQLLDARMKMNYSVYSHDTVNITETMLERATEFHIDDTGYDLTSFVGLGDDEYNTILTNSDSDRAKKLFQCVRNRVLYKTCFLDSLYGIDKDSLHLIGQELNPVKQHEENIADIADVERYKVLMSSPKYYDISAFETPIRTPKEKIRTLEESSTKPDSLRQSVLLNQNIHVFCTRDVREQVSEVADEYFHTLDETSKIIE